MDYQNLEYNQQYKDKPVEEWTMWDSACHDYDKMCEAHDAWMETEEGQEYYRNKPLTPSH